LLVGLRSGRLLPSQLALQPHSLLLGGPGSLARARAHRLLLGELPLQPHSLLLGGLGSLARLRARRLLLGELPLQPRGLFLGGLALLVGPRARRLLPSQLPPEPRGLLPGGLGSLLRLRARLLLPGELRAPPRGLPLGGQGPLVRARARRPLPGELRVQPGGLLPQLGLHSVALLVAPVPLGVRRGGGPGSEGHPQGAGAEVRVNLLGQEGGEPLSCLADVQVARHLQRAAVERPLQVALQGAAARGQGALAHLLLPALVLLRRQVLFQLGYL